MIAILSGGKEQDQPGPGVAGRRQHGGEFLRRAVSHPHDPRAAIVEVALHHRLGHVAIGVEDIGPVGGALAGFELRQRPGAQRVHAQRAAAQSSGW